VRAIYPSQVRQSGRVTVRPLLVLVDVANVMGSRPDGWWRDRAGAATRLLEALGGLAGREVTGPDGERVRVVEVVAVLEGRARTAQGPEGVRVRRAPADGDSEIAAAAAELAGQGAEVLVVTADRGLRARLPEGVPAAGPGWLNDLLGR
jgi:hypothetical protein